MCKIIGIEGCRFAEQILRRHEVDVEGLYGHHWMLIHALLGQILKFIQHKSFKKPKEKDLRSRCLAVTLVRSK